MSSNASYAATRAALEKYEITAQKKYGQNFLIDENILEKIVSAADVAEDDLVLEIGPGLGALTGLLCERAGKVVCVEIDRKLIPVLEEKLGEYDNLTIINGDIMKLDIGEALSMRDSYKKVKVVANLPYYITTPVIMKLLQEFPGFDSITVMIQKEVADRINAKPSTKEYGSLSLAVQYYSKPETVVSVPPGCFFPQPKVGSVVLKLDIYEDRPVKPENEELMFKLIRASFNQRRKTMVNSLRNFPGLDLEKDEIERALDAIKKKPTARGEELSLSEFAKLSGLL